MAHPALLRRGAPGHVRARPDFFVLQAAPAPVAFYAFPAITVLGGQPPAFRALRASTVAFPGYAAPLHARRATAHHPGPIVHRAVHIPTGRRARWLTSVWVARWTKRFAPPGGLETQRVCQAACAAAYFRRPRAGFVLQLVQVKLAICAPRATIAQEGQACRRSALAWAVATAPAARQCPQVSRAPALSSVPAVLRSPNPATISVSIVMQAQPTPPRHRAAPGHLVLRAAKRMLRALETVHACRCVSRARHAHSSDTALVSCVLSLGTY